MATTQTLTDDLLEWLTKEVKPTVDNRIDRSLRDIRYRDRLWYQVGSGGKRLRPGLVMLQGSRVGVIGPLSSIAQRESSCCTPSRSFTMISLTVIGYVGMLPHDGRSLALEAVQEMAVGQQLDFTFADRRDVTEAEYIEMVTKKTGALFDLCLELSQTLTGTDLGIDGYAALWPAFQIRDDLLDFEVGKGREGIGNDVRAGKRTLLAVHAADERVYNILDTLPERTTDEDVETVRNIFEETDSFEYARKRMHSHATEALTALESLPESPQRQRLTALGQFCIDRDH